jgi:hypothetical protein
VTAAAADIIHLRTCCCIVDIEHAGEVIDQVGGHATAGSRSNTQPHCCSRCSKLQQQMQQLQQLQCNTAAAAAGAGQRSSLALDK